MRSWVEHEKSYITSRPEFELVQFCIYIIDMEIIM